MERARKKTEIARLAQLLDVAGTATPWPVMEQDLLVLPLRTITGLVYRVERQLANSYEEGARHGQDDGG